MNTAKSKRTADAGCSACGRPFPVRVYFSTTTFPLDVARATFIIACRCGLTYPLVCEGMGVPPLGGERGI